MKETPLTKAVDRAVEIKLAAIDKIIEDLAEPIADVGNPEQLIGKPYNEWSPEDLKKLVMIYGSGKDSILTRTIFNKSYKQVQEDEKET